MPLQELELIKVGGGLNREGGWNSTVCGINISSTGKNSTSCYSALQLISHCIQQL